MDTVRRCGLCFFILDPFTKPCDAFHDHETPAVCLVSSVRVELSFTMAQLEDSVGRGCEACRRIRNLIHLCIPETKRLAARLTWATRPDMLMMPPDNWGRFLKWKFDGTSFMMAFELFSVRKDDVGDKEIPTSSNAQTDGAPEDDEAKKNDEAQDVIELDTLKTIPADFPPHPEPVGMRKRRSSQNNNGVSDEVISFDSHLSKRLRKDDTGLHVGEDDDAEGVEKPIGGIAYSAPDHKLGHPFAIFATQICGDTSSHRAIQRIKSWVYECSQSHERCPDTRRVPLPTRLVHIKKADGGVGLTVQLSETKGMCGRYICLSHCWGNFEPECITKRETLASNLTEIAWGTLPKTFQDAVTMTSWLGFEYIWIDSMCIVQDDHDDWHYESSEMANIYENAVLTLAATHSLNSKGGLFSTSRAEARQGGLPGEFEAVQMPDDGRGRQLFLRPIMIHPMLSESTNSQRDMWPLLNRAWVYQERLLSPRVVHFTNTELIWECAHHFACECSTPHIFSGGNPFYDTPPAKVRHGDLVTTGSYYHIKGARGGNIKTRWPEIIQEFSNLSLTFKKDRLPAIAGVAKQLARVGGDSLGQYLAGVWTKTLARDLLWCSLPYPELPDTRQAPTWSWASANSGVKCPRIVDTGDSKHGFELLQHRYETYGPDRYGEIKCASIVVSCPLLQTSLRLRLQDDSNEDQSVEYEVDLPVHPEAKTNTKKRATLYADYDFSREGKWKLKPGETVYCMSMRGCGRDFPSLLTWCILLRQVESRRPGVDTYERIGVLTAPYDLVEENWFRGWTKTNAKIIEII